MHNILYNIQYYNSIQFQKGYNSVNSKFNLHRKISKLKI